MINYLPGSW